MRWGVAGAAAHRREGGGKTSAALRVVLHSMCTACCGRFQVLAGPGEIDERSCHGLGFRDGGVATRSTHGGWLPIGACSGPPLLELLSRPRGPSPSHFPPISEMWSTDPHPGSSPGGLTGVKWRWGSGEMRSTDHHPDLSPGGLAGGEMQMWSTDPHPGLNPGGFAGG